MFGKSVTLIRNSKSEMHQAQHTSCDSFTGFTQRHSPRQHYVEITKLISTLREERLTYDKHKSRSRSFVQMHNV